MPANLSPDYIRAEREYKDARTPEDKLVCLQRMLTLIPKHKGTDKMQGDLKQRIARLRSTVESRIKKRGPSHRVKPEGAGQIMLVGPPNAGKSALLARLTHAEPEVADYPCTTREPVPGMAKHGDVQIQLVDLPPVWREHCEPFVFDNVRGADGVLLMLDLAARTPVEDVQESVDMLREKHLELVHPSSEIPLDEDGVKAQKALLVVNKCDLDEDGALTGLVREMLSLQLPVYAVSSLTGQGLDELMQAVFDLLDVIRVYTREHGKPPDMEAPYTVPTGSTVLDFAAHVHKDFYEHLKTARVWGSAKFDGQAVQRDHVLQDGDIVELTL